MKSFKDFVEQINGNMPKETAPLSEDKLFQLDETVSYVSEEYDQVLTENRLEFLAKNFKDEDFKDTLAQDSFATAKTSGDIINHFASADPSKNKAYTQWMLNQYKKKTVRQEDAPRLQTVLTNFDKYKNKLANKDINQYKHISDLDAAVRPHLGTAATNKEASEQIKTEGRDTLLDTPNVKVYHTKTKEASQAIYGGGSGCGENGTDWCTAARGQGSYFEHYNSKGPLIQIHIKGDAKSPYQYHKETGSFMDKEDREADLGKMASQHKELYDVKNFHSHLLTTSAKNGDIGGLTHLETKYGADLKEPGANGDTLLHHAAQGGHVAMVKHLMERGLSPATKNDSGETPFHKAISSGNEDVMDHMIAHG